jgi:hypothetical protein
MKMQIWGIDIDNIRDIITKDTGYWVEDNTQQLYIKKIKKQPPDL